MLNGRHALVTGSTGGLGFAIGRALALAGCGVMFTGQESEAEVAPKLGALREEAAGDVHYRVADLSDEAGAAALVNSAMASLGSIDILVNNAVVRHFAPVEKFDVAHWNHSLAVNLSAAFHTIRLTVPGMRAAGWGRIINMSSVYGSRGAANRIDYVTTKTALLGLTRAVAMETLRDGITCNAVCPGSVHTPASEQRIMASVTEGALSREEAERDFLAGKQPSGRFVEANDVAALVVFLCGPAGRDITGATLPVDGGWLAS
ncbi:MAG: SDR family oxidoreductase [Acetobacteraceae bacterium]